MPGFWFDIWCVSFLVSWQSKSFLLAGVLGCIMGRTKTMSSVCVCFCYPSFSEPYHSSSNPLNKWNVINIWIVQDLIPNKTHSEDFWTNQNELGTQPHGHLVTHRPPPFLPGWSSSHPPPALLDKRQVLFLSSAERRKDVSTPDVSLVIHTTYWHGWVKRIRFNWYTAVVGIEAFVCLKVAGFCSFVQSTSW